MKHFHRRAALALAILAAGTSTTPLFAKESVQPVSVEAVREHVAVLASDAFEGRKPGTMGEYRTLEYLSQQWASYGLVSGTNDPAHPWFQPVPLVDRIHLGHSVAVRGDDGTVPVANDGFLLNGPDATSAASGPLVFVGYGVDAQGKVNADVAGKIVLMAWGEPRFEGAANLPRRSERTEALFAAGAAAVLALAPAQAPWASLVSNLSSSTRLAAQSGSVGLTGLVRADQAALLLKTGFASVEEALSAASSADFAGTTLGLNVDLSSRDLIRPYNSYNVIAKLPGRKPGAGAIVLLGHWDHFGVCRGEEAEDRICNGAVDNASGMAVLLTVAERLAAGAPLDRDVYFMGTTAEERGLLGAYHFADNPVVPLDQIKLALNIDTVAIAPAGAPVAIIGRGKTPYDLEIEAVARSIGRTIEPSDDANAFITRQDGWALAARDVPALMVGGSFADLELLQGFLGTLYHGPDDELTADTPLEGAAEDATLHIALVRHFADSEAFDPPPVAKEMPGTTGE